MLDYQGHMPLESSVTTPNLVNRLGEENNFFYITDFLLSSVQKEKQTQYAHNIVYSMYTSGFPVNNFYF